MEGVVYEGWLVKSPPEKRILKAKWRQRWFVLRHSGLLPGQFVLEYFTDKTCKKIKGKIDLDQCEQVDAGLTFESKKTNYQHMFDIRTPKRIYYLVAETEGNMNKWVDCICSVCGLKIHIEEDYLAPLDSTTNAVVTSPPSTLSSMSKPTSSLAEKRKESNPYIPISECHTGKPVLNGNGPLSDSCKDLHKEALPLALKNESVLHSDSTMEFYDYPKPVNPSNINEKSMQNEIDDEDMYKVPLQLKAPVPSDLENAYNTMLEGSTWNTLPPMVNWHTYPQDSAPPSHSLTLGHTSSGKVNSMVYDIVPPSRSSNKAACGEKKSHELTNQFENVNLNDSGIDTQPSSSPSDVTLFQEIGSEAAKVPPRPPKPSKLRDKRHRYENFELPLQSSKSEDLATYDVPPSSKGIFLSKNLPAQVFSYLKDVSNNDLPLSVKVPHPSSSVSEISADASPSVKGPHPSVLTSEISMDDTYDFPKFRSEDNINVTVPLPLGSNTAQRHRRHAYTNAPPGLFNSKELIFNYEYRPSLMTADGYDANKAELFSAMTSDLPAPLTPPVLGAYANVPTSPSFVADTPPAVNRELKPRKSSIADERAAISFLTLQPPPVCKSRAKSTKRSFRKPRAAPSPTSKSGLNGTPPPVPNRFRYHPEVSTTSDDDVSSSGGSRRNSSNDEQARHFFATSFKKDEIQYLDLDLDSEPSQSPKSPERGCVSTVYKKVDFVKTKAFNEVRQNLEETYRKSQ